MHVHICQVRDDQVAAEARRGMHSSATGARGHTPAAQHSVHSHLPAVVMEEEEAGEPTSMMQIDNLMDIDDSYDTFETSSVASKSTFYAPSSPGALGVGWGERGAGAGSAAAADTHRAYLSPPRPSFPLPEFAETARAAAAAAAAAVATRVGHNNAFGDRPYADNMDIGNSMDIGREKERGETGEGLAGEGERTRERDSEREYTVAHADMESC